MLTAPYNSAMRLGQGFNTYTHEICINDAAIVDPQNPGGDEYGGDEHTVSQVVSYCTRLVDKVSQVTSAMNISAAASVKTAGAGGGLSGSYIDSDTFKESNLNFFCQVKVTNQVIMGRDLLKFNDLANVKVDTPHEFTKIYGDSYISGFIEGGELNAIISVKSYDKATINSIKASLEASFGKGGPGASASLSGDGGKLSQYALNQSETTITVNWNGGGIIKPKEVLWSVDSLVKVAAAFPEMVAHTPQRTHAILTKYTGLRSFYLRESTLPSPLNYTLAELYTNDLLDAFTDYKSIWKTIHQLAEEVEFGLATLKEAPPLPHHEEKPAHESEWFNVEAPSENMTDPEKAKAWDALTRKTGFKHNGQRYKPTLQDLDRARYHCRLEMGKILNEILSMEKEPSKAATANPSTIFLNPAIFRKLLPEKVQVESSASKDSTVPFYVATETVLPSLVSDWKDKVSATNPKLRMTGYGGDRDVKVSNNLKQSLFSEDGTHARVANTAYIENITVHHGADGVLGIQIKYQGQAQPWQVGKIGGLSTSASLVSNDAVTEVVVESAKYKGQAASHSAILGLTLRTRNGNEHVLGRNEGNKAQLSYASYTLKGPEASWSLRGLWVSLADNAEDGLVRLGGFFEQGS